MSRGLFTFFVALCFCLTFFEVSAAPLRNRQLFGGLLGGLVGGGDSDGEGGGLGGLSCNIARLRTVRNLSQTQDDVADISDPAVADAVAEAEAGLNSADDGISTIASAILSGEAPPEEARAQVGAGLTSAMAALESMDSDDEAIQAAMASLADTIEAGNDVVDRC